MDEKDPFREKPANPIQVESDDPMSHTPTPRPAETLPPEYHKSQSKKGRYFLIAVVILLVATGVYWFALKPKPAKNTSETNTITPKSTQSQEEKTAGKNYESSNFNLSFSYPDGWTVKDDATALTVVSPSMKLKDTSGAEFDGQIEINIVPNAANIKQLDPKDHSVAVLDSEKISYTKPSETQRANTYISFLNYYTSQKTGIDGIYITGDNGYQKNQAIPKSDIEKSAPLIYASFNKCPASSKCTEAGTPTTISADSWKDTNVSQPIKTLLQSLSIQ